MKINFTLFSTILIVICSFYNTYGQHNKKEYTFEMDRVIAEFKSELRKQKVDTVLQAFYLYDNGRGDKATDLLFWTKNGKHYVKAIKTAKKNSFKEFPIKECPEFKEILDFYFDNIKAIIGSKPKSKMWLSHNYGYSINLKINRTEFKTYLRDEKRMYDKEHFRSKWIHLIDQIARPYIEGK